MQNGRLAMRLRPVRFWPVWGMNTKTEVGPLTFTSKCRFQHPKVAIYRELLLLKIVSPPSPPTLTLVSFAGRFTEPTEDVTSAH